MTEGGSEEREREGRDEVFLFFVKVGTGSSQRCCEIFI